MKKLLLILTTIFAISLSIYAEDVKVLMTDGKEIKGKLVSYNESLLIIEPNTIVKYEKTLSPQKVICFEIEGVGLFKSQGGMFVLEEKSVSQQEIQRLANDSTKEVPTDFWQRVLSERTHMTKIQPSNPNEVIGRAFLSTGGVALGIGLPCFVAGIATCVAGNVNVTTSNIEQKANCVEASYYLFGVGASLTIISIPLIVHGRRIADMKVNYTGNGVGTTVNF